MENIMTLLPACNVRTHVSPCNI